MKKELRVENLTLRITRDELYMISRKAKALGMSRPNLVIDAVIEYEKEKNLEIDSPLLHAN